jgi:hypothetical protein
MLTCLFINCLKTTVFCSSSYYGRVPTADAAAAAQYFGIPADRRRVFTLEETQAAIGTESLLRDRKRCSVDEFSTALDIREHAHGKVPSKLKLHFVIAVVSAHVCRIVTCNCRRLGLRRAVWTTSGPARITLHKSTTSTAAATRGRRDQCALARLLEIIVNARNPSCLFFIGTLWSLLAIVILIVIVGCCGLFSPCRCVIQCLYKNIKIKN